MPNFNITLVRQVVLCYPVCVVLYALISLKFFADQIEAKEYSVLNFF